MRENENRSVFDQEEALEIIERLAFAAEYKHSETLSHIQRMSYYTELLARICGFSERICEIIRFASPMHDIGKVGIPDNILLKPGKLTLEEWEIMKTHTTIGAKLLAGSVSPLLKAGQLIAAFHHERWDGTGYPEALAGDYIPLGARITAIADVFDALTSDRPYEKAWPVDDAVDVIKLGRETQFDPQLVDQFIKFLPEFVAVKQRFPEKAQVIEENLESERPPFHLV